eukprot:12423500-Heterocapsa_arctica.AAC.1
MTCGTRSSTRASATNDVQDEIQHDNFCNERRAERDQAREFLRRTTCRARSSTRASTSTS